MACFLLFTGPPLPRLPDRNVPCFLRRIALLTNLAADFPYRAIVPSDHSAFDISAASATDKGRLR